MILTCRKYPRYIVKWKSKLKNYYDCWEHISVQKSLLWVVQTHFYYLQEKTSARRSVKLLTIVLISIKREDWRELPLSESWISVTCKFYQQVSIVFIATKIIKVLNIISILEPKHSNTYKTIYILSCSLDVQNIKFYHLSRLYLFSIHKMRQDVPVPSTAQGYWVAKSNSWMSFESILKSLSKFQEAIMLLFKLLVSIIFHLLLRTHSRRHSCYDFRKWENLGVEKLNFSFQEQKWNQRLRLQVLMSFHTSPGEKAGDKALWNVSPSKRKGTGWSQEQ